MGKIALPERFTLIAVNGMELSKGLPVSKLTRRCMMAAQLLDHILNGRIILSRKRASFKDEKCIAYEDLKRRSSAMTLEGWMNYAQDLKPGEIDLYADKLICEMNGRGLMDIIPSLVECDINYRMSGIKVKQYRSLYEQYRREIETIRAETLGGDAVSDEVSCLVWLLKQNGDLQGIFSDEEIIRVKNAVTRSERENTFAHELFAADIKGGAERGWKSFLLHKSEMLKAPFGIGMSSAMSAMQRNDAIFIETEKMLHSVDERIAAVKAILESSGHIFKVRSKDEASLVEIDNVLYELVPDAIRQRMINVHGVRLRRCII